MSRLTADEVRGIWDGVTMSWDENFRFDEDMYATNVERAIAAKVHGIYTTGTTGEFYAIEYDEFCTMVDIQAELCGKASMPLQIGCCADATAKTIKLVEYAASKSQVGAVQIVIPYWMEVDDIEVVPFFKSITDACPGLALTIYETQRAKKTMTVDQHRAVHDLTGCYLVVKANADTVGNTIEGCQQLSEFINVWVGESQWSRLGPHGAIGGASSLVYMNPRVLLLMFDLMKHKKWDELQPWTDLVNRLFDAEIFSKKGFTDTAEDRLTGVVTDFLSMSVRSRGPYSSAADEDVRQLHTWMTENTPALLDL